MERVKLTQDKYALIDDEDLKLVSEYKWHYGNGYAKRRDHKSSLCRMHHLILPLKKGYMVDHINGNRLDNRRNNLRLVTKSQNMMNRGLQKNSKSGYMGVSWHKKTKSWRAYIKKDRKQIYLGLYDTKIQAAKAYNEAAKEYHGEFAFFNKI